MEHVVSSALIGEIEEALGQVSEIRAARVVTSSEGFIDEIHVLALPSKAPKQLVRDIEVHPHGCLWHRHRPQEDLHRPAGPGVRAHHRRLPQAQGAGADQEHQRRGRGRLREHLGGARARGRVVRGPRYRAGEPYRAASAWWPKPRSTRSRSTSRARSPSRSKMWKSSAWAGRASPCACVVLVTSLGEQAFAGSALVRQNDKDSIVRATLDAINRRLGFLTTP